MKAQTDLLAAAEAFRDRTRHQSQVEIAKALGISQQTVSAVLAAKHEPGLSTKLKIRKVFGVPLDVWPTSEVITESELPPVDAPSPSPNPEEAA